MDLELRALENMQLQIQLGDASMREQMTPREEVVWIEQQQLISDQEAAYYERREAQD
jgi:CBS domain containing-hemolysin-like protein